MPSELDTFQSLPRHARRKLSRKLARAMPIEPLPKRDGEIAELVNRPRLMMPRVHHADRVPTSGQYRVNAKRNQRAEYWRTVKIRVSAALEPHFRERLDLLGLNARILGRHELEIGFAVDLDVHIPGAPTEAERAEPVYTVAFDGDTAVPRLDHIVWYDAKWQRLDVETPQQMIEHAS